MEKVAERKFKKTDANLHNFRIIANPDSPRSSVRALLEYVRPQKNCSKQIHGNKQ